MQKLTTRRSWLFAIGVIWPLLNSATLSPKIFAASNEVVYNASSSGNGATNALSNPSPSHFTPSNTASPLDTNPHDIIAEWNSPHGRVYMPMVNRGCQRIQGRAENS